MPILAIAAGVVIIGAFVALVETLGPRLWQYELEEQGVRCVFLKRFEWWRIQCKDITDVEVMSYWEIITDQSLKFHWRSTRNFTWLKVVIVVQDRRAFILSPFSPEVFARAVTRLCRDAEQLTDGSQHLDLSLPQTGPPVKVERKVVAPPHDV